MEVILVFVVALLVGVIVGFIVRGVFFKATDAERKARTELKLVKAEFAEYQSQVTQHIGKTAEMITNVQDGCQTVQEHIFSAAQNLNRDESRQSILQPSTAYIDRGDTDPQVSAEPKKSAPPKDYAG